MCIATLALVGVGMAAGGQLMSGIAQGKAASYQAQVASNNAQIERQNAAYSASAGAAQTEQASMKAAARDSQVRAGLAANNVDVNSGSAADVQTGQREIGQLDAETTANNAALEAYGYQTQATGYQAQSKLDSMEASAAPWEGALKAGGTILGSPSADSAISSGWSSLMSGNPEVPPAYQWMQTDYGDTGVGMS